jgi:DNA-binding transcriptional MocR family regulator
MERKQAEMFKAETTWFHVFVSMIENGDVAKMGPYAVTVYLVVKAYTNWKTGRAFPSIETIVEKSGISRAQVMRSLSLLVEHGYIDKTKQGRKNNYTLREKITFKDQEGRPAACATWDYLPSTVEAARAELKRFMLSGEYDGKVLYVEKLNLNVQINQGDHNFNHQGKLDPATEAALARLKASFDQAKEKQGKAK